MELEVKDKVTQFFFFFFFFIGTNQLIDPSDAARTFIISFIYLFLKDTHHGLDQTFQNLNKNRSEAFTFGFQALAQ